MHGAFAVSVGSHDAWKNESKNFMKSHLNFSIPTIWKNIFWVFSRVKGINLYKLYQEMWGCKN